MKIEIVESQNIAELDRLVNTCIQERKVKDIKFATSILKDNTIKYTALIMMGD